MSRNADIDLRSSFSASTDNLFYMGLQNNPDPQAAVTFEQIFPDVNVALPDVDVPDINVNQAQIPDFNSSGIRNVVEGVKTDITANVEQLQNFFLNSLQNIHGKDVGNQMMGKALACGGTTLTQTMVTLADPTPGAIAIGMAVYAENKGPRTPEIEAAMDEVICRARQNAGDQQMSMEANNEAPPIPQGMNLDNITGKQMYQFFQTPVEDLPCMRAIAQVEHSLDNFDDKARFVQEHGHETVNSAKLAVADEVDLVEMAGSEYEVAEFVVEHDAGVTEYSAYAVEITADSLQAPGALAFSLPEFATKAEIEANMAEMDQTAGVSLDAENALVRAAQAFNPANNASMMG